MVTCLSLADGAATIKLTWGPTLLILTHLTIAGSNGSSCEIYYRKQKPGKSTASFCDLDVDDISSFGPEITTLPSLVSERYRFCGPISIMGREPSQPLKHALN